MTTRDPIRLTDRSPATDRERRERLGISVDDFAARADLTPQELTTYEQAKSEQDVMPSVSLKVGDALDALERDADASSGGPSQKSQ